MNREALQRRIQLLLSWREQAGKLLRQSPPGVATSRMYQAHARQADFYLRRTVGTHHGLIEKLGLELQAALAESARIDERARAGRIREADANMAKQEIERRVERLRLEITAYNTLLRARRSSDAGGFIELPIAEYAAKLGILPIVRIRAGWERRHFIGIVVLAIVCVVGGWAYYREEAAVRITCSGARSGSPVVAVSLTLTNDSHASAQLYVPWPVPPPSTELENPCGLFVYARQTGAEDFRLVPTYPAEWQHLGAALTGFGTISLPPGVSETFTLNVSAMRARLKDLEAVRVEVTDTDNVALCSQEWDALPAS